MQKILFFLLSIVSLSSLSQSYKTVNVGPEESISIKIPDGFSNMSDQDRMNQAYSSKVPLAMFSNESQDVTLSINYNIMQWTDKDTELIYGFYKASVNNLFDNVEFIQDETKEINGRTFIVFETLGSIENDNTFSSRRSSKVYNYIQYTSWNDQVLLFNFSCRGRVMNEWQQTAAEIMESIKIKK